MEKFDSAIGMEAYLSQHSRYLSTEYSQLHNCSLDCPSERRYHKMPQRYRVCNCSPDCTLKSKSIVVSSQVILLFITNVMQKAVLTSNEKMWFLNFFWYNMCFHIFLCVAPHRHIFDCLDKVCLLLFEGLKGKTIFPVFFD